jgi:hypothetical protein
MGPTDPNAGLQTLVSFGARRIIFYQNTPEGQRFNLDEGTVFI